MFQYEAYGASSWIMAAGCLLLTWLGGAKWYKNRRKRQLLDKIPSAPGYPFIGNGLTFLTSENPVAAFSSLCDKIKDYQGILRARVFIEDYVVLTKPEHVMTLGMGRNLDKATFYDHVHDLVDGGILNITGAPWKRIRKVYQTHFLSSNAPQQEFLDEFEKHGKEMVQSLTELYKDGEYHRLLEPLLYTSGQALFGFNADNEPISGTLKEIVCHDMCLSMDIVYKRIFSMRYYFAPIFKLSPLGRVYRRIKAKFRATGIDILLRMKAKWEEMERKGEVPPNRFVYHLFDNHRDKDVDYLVSEFLMLVPVGIDTSVQTMGFVLIMLGLHPEIEEKVFLEDQRIRKMMNGREPTLEDMKQYVYLDMCIKETLRMFPVGPLLGRCLSEDTYFGEYLVPAKTNVIAIPLHINRDEKIYPNAKIFDPERFTPENTAKIPPGAFAPFMVGPRNCPGQKYAMLSMKSNISTIVRNFKIIPKHKTMEDVFRAAMPAITLHETTGFTVKLQLRDTSG